MRRSLTLGLFCTLVACGGGETSEPEPAPADSAGDEAPAPAEEAPPPVVEAPPPTGPGQLTVQVEVGGDETAASVRVVDASNDTVAEGQSGQTFALEAGRYRVYATIGEGAVLVDTPTRELDGGAIVSPGATEEVTVEFGVARVRLNVQRRGRPVARWTARVQRQGMDGDEPIELRPSEEHIAISPGRYDATITIGGEEITVNGLIFQGGARQTVPVDIN